MLRKVLLLFTAVILLCLIYTGCADKAALGITDTYATVNEEITPAEESSGISDSDSVSIECSVSLSDFSINVAETYGAENSIEALSTAVGTSGALASLSEDNCDLALFSGSPEDAGDYDGVTTKVIGAEMITFITGASSERKDITTDEIYSMFAFSGSLGFYAEEDTAGTSNASVALASSGSSARILFEELFGLRGEVNGMMKTLVPDTANEFASNEEIIEFVKSNPGTIGVLSGTYVSDEATALTINGISPDSEDYSGRRAIVAAYKESNGNAASLISFLDSDSSDPVYGNNGMIR